MAAERTSEIERTTSKQTDFDKMTVKDYIEYEAKERDKMMRKLISAQEKETKKMLQSIYEYQYNLEKQGIVLSEKEKKFLLEMAQKEELKKQNELALEYYKSRGVYAKKEEERANKELERQKKAWEEINNLIKQAEEETDPKKKKGLEKEAKDAERKERQTEAIVKGLEDAKKHIGNAISEGLANLNNAVNSAISTFASYQQKVNVRLQGINSDINVWGSAFDLSGKSIQGQLRKVAMSPFLKTEDLYNNLVTLVEEGIASNVAQRAFLQTIKDNVAKTFDANDASLRRIIRLQQYDSTAARLGMEAYLTKFMNALVENTEYLTSSFDTVTASLLEASSLLEAKASTEFEYTVQKWLGTLTGVGLSDTTAQNIAQAIGYLGSGNISALSGSEMQNLLVMAASRNPNLNYSELLSGGLTSTTANQLLGSVVAYLQEIGSGATSNVVLSEMAKIFGVSVSDLVAASHIDYNTSKSLLGNELSYYGMYDTLEEYTNAGRLLKIMGLPAVMENLFSNFTSSTGASIAANPILYSMWKITDMIQGVTGGIPIPFIDVFGTGIDLNTTVENLIKLGLVGTSTLGQIGSLIVGAATADSGSGNNFLLRQMGIGADVKSNVITRGTGLESRSSGLSTSVTTFVGNTEGSDYSESAMSQAMDEQEQKKKEQTPEETVEDEINAKLDTLLKGDEGYDGLLVVLGKMNANLGSINEKTDNSSITDFINSLGGGFQ